MRTVFVASLFMLLLGCGPVTATVSSGAYTLASGFEPAGSTLTIDVAAKTATLARPNQADVALTLTAVPRESWLRGCPTNFSSVLLETFSVSPAPLAFGPVNLASPVLSAGCGLDRANEREVSLSSGTSSVRFTR